MTHLFTRSLILTAVFGAYTAATFGMTTAAAAAQPWWCTCKGTPKRFLASTRHCEFQFKLPRGQSCTKRQYTRVYGPACAEMGCKLKPLQ
jgi:hypothetical protein